MIEHEPAVSPQLRCRSVPSAASGRENAWGTGRNASEHPAATVTFCFADSEIVGASMDAWTLVADDNGSEDR